jgi:tetratricopeptide (TPR) repeat protein
MPGPIWYRRPKLLPDCLACLGVLLLAISGVGPLGAQTAAPSRAEALLEQAKALAEGHRYAEAEQACLAALKEYEARGGDAASRLPVCRCQNQLAEVQTRLHKFRDSQGRLAANRDALRPLLAQQPGDPALRLVLARACELQAGCTYASGRPVEAVAPLREAIGLVEKLAAEDPERAEYREELVRLLTTCGGYQTALARYPEAEAAFDEALKVGQKLVTDSPGAAKPMEELAHACNAYALLAREEGRPSRAADLLRESIRWLAKLESAYPDHPEYWHPLPAAYRTLTQPQGYRRNEAESAAAGREAERLEARLAAVPEAARKWLTDEDRVQGSLQVLDRTPREGRQAEVDRLARAWQKEVQDHPDAPRFRVQLSTAKALLALRFLSAGDKEPAVRAAREALELDEQLVGQFPDVPAYRTMSAEACFLNGITNLLCGKPAEGERYLQQGNAVLEKLAQEQPGDPQTRYRAAVALLNACQTLGGQGDAAGARRYFRASLALMKQLAEAFPQCPKYRREVAQTTITFGHLQLSQGDAAGAEASYREGVGLWRQLAADFPACPAFRQSLGDALANLCGYLYKNDRLADSGSLYPELIRLHEGLVRDSPQDPEHRATLANDYALYGRVMERQEQLALAAECYSRTIVCLDSARQLDPRQRDWLSRLRVILQDRAYVYQRLGRHAEHEADLRRAQELDEGLQPAVVRLARIRQRLDEGQPSPAMKEADDVFAEGALSASQWRELAGLYSRASAADAAQQEVFAARAVEALRRACEQGCAGAVPLNEDPQFHNLAGRADFQKLAALPRK